MMQLFSIQPTKARKALHRSNNPIVFHDYESFLAKFNENPKTTDECWTPQDVYEAVVKYVGTVTDLSDKVILRPFYPGGNFENAEYPANGIVIDNPPFSIFKKIVNFYTYHEIPFFLFGPGMTIFNVCQVCTVVVTGFPLTYSNGAQVPGNFASSLFGDITAMTAPKLYNLLKACPSQRNEKPLIKYEYPDNVCSVANLHYLCRRNVDFCVHKGECVVINSLDNNIKSKDGRIFGSHLLISDKKAREKKILMETEKVKEIVKIDLSDREKGIVAKL